MALARSRSLDRGITLLEILAISGAMTLSQLHRESGLPKSTVRRLLATLQSRRLVRRSLSDNKFRINVTMPMSGEPPVPRGMALLVDVAMPILIELTARIEWPSDIHVLDGYTMRVGDTTRPLSPFLLHGGLINRSVNMFGSATGLACLGAMPDAQVERLMAQAEADPIFGPDGTRLGRARIMEEVARTRERGYGVRVSDYLGEILLDDRLSAIAVAVLQKSKPVGAISLVYPKLLMPPEAMAESYLERMRAAADQISSELSAIRSLRGDAT